MVLWPQRQANWNLKDRRAAKELILLMYWNIFEIIGYLRVHWLSKTYFHLKSFEKKWPNMNENDIRSNNSWSESTENLFKSYVAIGWNLSRHCAHTRCFLPTITITVVTFFTNIAISYTNLAVFAVAVSHY